METALVIAAIVGGTASGITKVIGGIALWNRFFKKPKLELYTEVKLEGSTGGPEGRRYICKITYGIINNGRAIAKHVQLSLCVVHYGVDVGGGLDANGNHGLPRVHSIDGFTKFAADADQVIHPKRRLPVAATRLWIPGASPVIKDAVIIYEISAEGATGGKDDRRYICKITYGIVNNGRAIAKHVQLSLRAVHYGVDVEGGLDGNGNHELPLVPSVDGFIKFASDANSVIHPKGRLPVAATRLWIPGASPNKIKDAVIIYEISAEGAKTVQGEQTITAAEMIKRVVPKIA